MPAISIITKLINSEAIIKQPLLLNSCESADVQVDVLRLDLIHPVISGNKYFKLKVAIENAIADKSTGIVSFGGAYSNHLVALAYLCKAVGLTSIGMIRGEQPPLISPTLMDAVNYGMKLVFVTRHEYSEKEQLLNTITMDYPGFKIIPEGGQSREGVEGASEILAVTDSTGYDVIVCAVGTGTMLTGLLKGSSGTQDVIGISSLKIEPGNDIETFIRSFSSRKFTIIYDYHFGGYAKKTEQLIRFMNQLWQENQLPTDFVYTAKMIFGLNDLIEKKHFRRGSRILVIHSGGLQGNRSIADKLNF